MILLLLIFQAYMALNDIDAAAESFKKALELEPNDGGIKRELAAAKKKVAHTSAKQMLQIPCAHSLFICAVWPFLSFMRHAEGFCWKLESFLLHIEGLCELDGWVFVKLRLGLSSEMPKAECPI
ncbi:Peptidyl-prolyl cis-trans isomerase CYP40 [Vitis vinifera]|uniref:Peptidyl-prolyl cis-trans isomerase CYP40 n=1 Tax=Vitis vinifera TaxID=29760 RepID=A0A438FMG5_VITVI|nr:Peptidyl-prolyl cis-trans isomerase CYP40 [Vitis vinifera]